METRFRAGDPAVSVVVVEVESGVARHRHREAVALLEHRKQRGTFLLVHRKTPFRFHLQYRVREPAPVLWREPLASVRRLLLVAVHALRRKRQVVEVVGELSLFRPAPGTSPTVMRLGQGNDMVGVEPAGAPVGLQRVGREQNAAHILDDQLLGPPFRSVVIAVVALAPVLRRDGQVLH